MSMKKGIDTKGKDDADVFLGLPLYRSYGQYLHKKQLYKEAVKYYNSALFVELKDKLSLTGRTDSYLKLQEYKEALKDAKKLLEINPEDLNALYRKTQALYLTSEFEHSLIFNHRGLRMRKKPEVFDTEVKAVSELSIKIIKLKRYQGFYNV